MAGNHNSGNRTQFGKSLTTSKLILDIQQLKRHTQLQVNLQYQWHWLRNGQYIATISIYNKADSIRLMYQTTKNEVKQSHDYEIRLSYTPCHLGGVRAWFICPSCHKRVAKLYGGTIFACRTCQNLAYPVSGETDLHRQTRKLNKMRERLGWEAGFLNGRGDKPKHMHWSTFEKLMKQYHEQELLTCERIDKYFYKAFKRPSCDFIN